MKFYFAPMEGVTGHIYRNAHHTFFQDTDKYFSPFIVARQNENYKTRENNDILPENNAGLVLIPQLLANNAKDFNHTAKKLKWLGYDEINLNLGCPSGTVVSKGRGAGFLSKREELDLFLEEIFSEAVTRISIKTRIGRNEPEEFYELIGIFNKYPMEELIIHPRVQKDYYNNVPNLKIFRDALSLSRNKVCYNGDIFSVEAYEQFADSFPEVDTLMLGRGLLINPGLIGCILKKTKTEKDLLKRFYDHVYEEYKIVLNSDVNVLYKMKELWFYMAQAFADSEKYVKKIRKAQTRKEYDEAVEALFRDLVLL